MITLYACLGSGNCMKPWLAMTQLQMDFDLEIIDVLQGEQREPPYLAVNPLGVVPYLSEDADTAIGESNAMLWYLAEGSALMPPTPAARAKALQWMFFEQSKLEPYISPARFFTTILPSERTARAAEIAEWQKKAREGLAFLDANLGDHPFLLESGYSIADIAVFGYVHIIDEAGIALSDFPNISNWVTNVTQTDRFSPLSDLQAKSRKAA